MNVTCQNVLDHESFSVMIIIQRTSEAQTSVLGIDCSFAASWPQSSLSLQQSWAVITAASDVIDDVWAITYYILLIAKMYSSRVQIHLATHCISLLGDVADPLICMLRSPIAPIRAINASNMNTTMNP